MLATFTIHWRIISSVTSNLSFVLGFFFAESLCLQCLPFFFIDVCMSPGPSVNQLLGSGPLTQPILAGFLIAGVLSVHIFSIAVILFVLGQAAPSRTLFLTNCSPRMWPRTPMISGCFPVGVTPLLLQAGFFLDGISACPDVAPRRAVACFACPSRPRRVCS